MPNDQSEPSAIAQLVPTIPDAQKAEAYKDRLRPVLQQVCEIMDEAARDGFILQMSLGMVPPGKNVIQQLLMVKQF